MSLAIKMWSELGLDHPFAEYNKNIVRFRYFVSQLIASVKELTTQSRTTWWKSHDVPHEPVYYAITAAMANPEANDLEKKLFSNPLSYGGADNYDDVTLLQNNLDYTRITRSAPHQSGISLNDSQVSLVQAAFLPNVITQLRASNAGLKTKFLGIAGTHHWGMALRVVNKNIFSSTGGANGFPREAMLRALSEQILLDLAHP